MLQKIQQAKDALLKLSEEQSLERLEEIVPDLIDILNQFEVDIVKEDYFYHLSDWANKKGELRNY